MSENDGSMEGTRLFLLNELRERGVSWRDLDQVMFMEVICMLQENRNLQYQEGVLDMLTFVMLHRKVV